MVTMNKTRQAVHGALEKAVSWDMLPANPLAHVDRLPKDRKQQEIFPIEELNALFCEIWLDVRAWSACVPAAKTGARVGEIRALKIKHVHFVDRYIDIVHNWSEYDWLKVPKNTKPRLNVAIDDVVAIAIGEVVKIHPYAEDPEAFVYFTPYTNSQPCDSKVFTRGLRARIKELDLHTGRTFHCFRHTWISMQAEIMPADKVAKLVGQKSVDVTRGYISVTEDDQKRSREVSSRMFQPPSP